MAVILDWIRSDLVVRAQFRFCEFDTFVTLDFCQRRRSEDWHIGLLPIAYLHSQLPLPMLMPMPWAGPEPMPLPTCEGRVGLADRTKDGPGAMSVHRGAGGGPLDLGSFSTFKGYTLRNWILFGILKGIPFKSGKKTQI